MRGKALNCWVLTDTLTNKQKKITILNKTKYLPYTVTDQLLVRNATEITNIELQ